MRRIPIAVRSKIVEKVVNVDEGPRPDISLAALTKLRPVFAAKGSVTAGNASQMSDGAGAAILVSEKILKQYNLKPLARVGQRRRRASRKSWGSGPSRPSHGHSSSPVSSRTTSTGSNSTRPRRPGPGLHAYPQSRSREGQPARRCDRAGSPARRDSAIRVATLVSAMQRDPKIKHGMVSMCIGTGMGFAAIFERV